MSFPCLRRVVGRAPRAVVGRLGATLLHLSLACRGAGEGRDGVARG